MALREVAVIIQADSVMTKLTYIICHGRNNLIIEISALITQIEITAAATRLYVTSSWYLRLRRIAKNLFAQRAVTLNNVAKMKRFVAKIKSFVGIRRISLFRFEFIACATTIG